MAAVAGAFLFVWPLRCAADSLIDLNAEGVSEFVTLIFSDVALLVLFGRAALVFCDQVPRLALLSFPVKFPLRHAARQQCDG